jgi:hypothetical protein
MERYVPDSRPWAQAVHYAWDARRRAAPCGTSNLFCGCARCAALPAKPSWMASPQALVAMADRVVAARPGNTESWDMHASAHWNIQSWPAASKSYAKAARLYGDEGDEPNKATQLGNAEKCRNYAEEEAKAAADAEAVRMAPIMAARKAAADAAMEALLAEEEQEKAATKPRKQGKGKGKGRRK